LVHKLAKDAQEEVPAALLRVLTAVPHVADEIISDIIDSTSEKSTTTVLLNGLLKARISTLGDEEARQKFIDVNFQKVHTLMEAQPTNKALGQVQLSLLQSDLKLA